MITPSKVNNNTLNQKNLNYPQTSFIRTVRNKDNPYVQVHSACFRNKNLSLKSKGLLAYFFTHKDGYRISVKGTVACLKESRDSVLSGFKELIENKHMIRYQPTDKLGRKKEMQYLIYEQADCPQYKEDRERLKKFLPQTDFPDTVNLTQSNINTKVLLKEPNHTFPLNSQTNVSGSGLVSLDEKIKNLAESKNVNPVKKPLKKIVKEPLKKEIAHKKTKPPKKPKETKEDAIDKEMGVILEAFCSSENHEIDLDCRKRIIRFARKKKQPVQVLTDALKATRKTGEDVKDVISYIFGVIEKLNYGTPDSERETHLNSPDCKNNEKRSNDTSIPETLQHKQNKKVLEEFCRFDSNHFEICTKQGLKFMCMLGVEYQYYNMKNEQETANIVNKLKVLYDFNIKGENINICIK